LGPPLGKEGEGKWGSPWPNGSEIPPGRESNRNATPTAAEIGRHLE